MTSPRRDVILFLPANFIMMQGKNFDIPFRTPTSLGDFICKDGELSLLSGAILTDNADGSGDDTFYRFEFVKDYKPALPPAPDVTFSLRRSTLVGWHPYPEAFPTKSVSFSDTSQEASGKMAKQVLDDFQNDALRQNLLTAPLLIMAVWRLYSGELISPSSPVLLVPNSEPPVISSADPPGNDNLELRVSAALGKIVWKISLPEILRDMVGKIRSLEIMVSRPLELYDAKASFLYCRNISTSNFIRHIDNEYEETEDRVCTINLPYAWIPAGPSFGSEHSRISSLREFYTISSIPLGELEPLERFQELPVTAASFADAYTSRAYVPSYAMFSLQGAAGAVSVKGKTLLWNPLMQAPSINEGLSPALTPRWVFHPDPDAREFRFTDRQGITRSLPLSRHPYLYGSFFWRDLSPGDSAPRIPSGPVIPPPASSLPSYIWSSLKSEIPVFEDSGLQDLECGEIKAVCRAFRASALVATVTPTLYVFSDEGVYLYKETSSGSYADAGLIARHILSSPEFLQMMATGVKFVTTQGSTVNISGTTVKALSVSDPDNATEGEIISATASGERLKIVTRPLKLSGAGNFKRLRKVYLRGNFDCKEISVTVYGSRDLVNWYMLGKRSSSAVVFLNPVDCRFFRIEIEGKPLSGSTFQGFSLLVG